MDISVIIMAYNEVANLETVVREIEAVLKKLRTTYEILIIDDGSTDGTSELVDRLQSELPAIKVVRHSQNLGLGGVYRTGFAQARGQWVTFFPADGQFPATIIQQFFAYTSEVDMVLGYLPQRKRSWVAEFLSWMERQLYRLILGPFPKFQGIVMFRRDLLDQFQLQSTGRGWAVLMEFILRVVRAGYRVKSVPTEVRPRLSGKSKVNNWRTMWANFRQVVNLRQYLK